MTAVLWSQPLTPTVVISYYKGGFVCFSYYLDITNAAVCCMAAAKYLPIHQIQSCYFGTIKFRSTGIGKQNRPVLMSVMDMTLLSTSNEQTQSNKLKCIQCSPAICNRKKQLKGLEAQNPAFSLLMSEAL